MRASRTFWLFPGLLSLVVLAHSGSARQVRAQGPEGEGVPLGVSHYDALVEPDLARKAVKGNVTLTLSREPRQGESLVLDRGDLEIDGVEATGAALSFELSPRKIQVRLADPAMRQITVRYHGTPSSGLTFVPERRVMYTSFATSQWMVVEDAPDHRATLRLRLIAPRSWEVVSNGREVAREAFNDRADLSEWRQDHPVPSYTFGFVAGEFSRSTQDASGVALWYLANGFSPSETQRIFGESARMLDFFRERAGVAYPGDQYSQVVVPRTAGQEMAGFSVVSEEYARAVLADPLAGSLLAHEFAHQWWGNMVTCQAWTHFWLNEGFATFMAAVYRERRFGRDVYLKDIDGMRARYERVRDAGHDRSLVFPDWIRPTADDRTLVYQKGGYVLHLLREEIGDSAFWSGIASYTTTNFGKSVTTDDLRRAMEQASKRNLDAFFSMWIY